MGTCSSLSSTSKFSFRRIPEKSCGGNADSAVHLLLPLLAAIFFALGSMVFKRAYEEGAGVVHAVVVNNILLAVVFLPLFAFERGPVRWSQWFLPLLTGAAFAAGHLLNVLSLKVGDVSVATPLLGAKVIFVAILARLIFGWPLSTMQWFAAALTTAGVFLMGVTDLKTDRRAGTHDAAGARLCSGFSLTDVMIQSWATDFGVFNFLPLQFIALAIFSTATIPLLVCARCARRERHGRGFLRRRRCQASRLFSSPQASRSGAMRQP